MPYADRESKNAYQRGWYQRNAEKHKAMVARTRGKKRAELVEKYKQLKSAYYCEKCGETHPATLDFHHPDPSTKKGCVSWLVYNSSWENVLIEITKCVCLCSNCHRKIRWEKEQGSKDIKRS
jgi:hypothetical protein